jgi:hypothetical protein
MVASCFLAPVFNTIPRTPSSNGPIVFATNLHNCVCYEPAGMSISTLLDDFPLGIDSSEKAMASLPAPNGINGGESKVGGTGPMIVRAKSGELIIDPDGPLSQAWKGPAELPGHLDSAPEDKRCEGCWML